MENLEHLFENKLAFDLLKKVELAKCNETELCDYKKMGISINAKIKNSKLRESSENKTMDIIKKLDECVQQSGVNYSGIDFAVVTGGTSKHPLIVEQLLKRFTPEQLIKGDTQKQVVKGLSIFAHEMLAL